MGLFICQRGCSHSGTFGQHRLPQGQPRERGGVEGGEGVERIALEAGPLGGGHHEAVIEGGIVATMMARPQSLSFMPLRTP